MVLARDWQCSLPIAVTLSRTKLEVLLEQHWIYSLSIGAWVLILLAPYVGWAIATGGSQVPMGGRLKVYEPQMIIMALFMTLMVMSACSSMLKSPEAVIVHAASTLLNGTLERFFWPLVCGLVTGLLPVTFPVIDVDLDWQLSKFEVWSFHASRVYVVCFMILLAFRVVM